MYYVSTRQVILYFIVAVVTLIIVIQICELKMSYLWKKHVYESNIGIKCEHKIRNEKTTTLSRHFQEQIAEKSRASGIPNMLKMKKKQKRFRSAFTTMQISILEKEFQKDPYVTNVRREQIANALHLPERAIKIWFQNRRMKEKRDASKGAFDTDDHLDTRQTVKTPINDDRISKLTRTTNQQTTPTSLATNIVFGDEEIVKTTENKIPNDIKCSVQNIKPDEIVINSCEAMKIDKDSEVKGESTPTPEIRINFVPVAKSRPYYVQNEKGLEKQPVGYINPYTHHVQEPQNIPENLSTSHSRLGNDSNKRLEEMSSHPLVVPSQSTIGYPVDLSKYYASAPSNITPWNRLDFIPIMPNRAQLPLYANPQGTFNGVSNGPSKKCSCNCHDSASFDQIRYEQHPMFYGPFVSQFVTSLPKQ